MAGETSVMAGLAPHRPCWQQGVAMHLVVAGLGYAGTEVARRALAAGMTVTGTRREPEGGEAADSASSGGPAVLRFAEAGPALRHATHLLVTAAPGEAGDPVLQAHGAAIAAAERLRWVGYMSTTAVYGDLGGGWAEEATPPAPRQDRAHRRLAAERAWATALVGRGAALDLFRTAGIYGPGRSALDDLRAGRARRVDRPGHVFSRIHRDDIAAAILAGIARPPAPGQARVLNLADDEPAAGADVVAEAARLLGLEPPPLVSFAEAWEAMSPMGRSFWSESRRVRSAATKAALGIEWRYPSYREGLRGILAAEAGQGGAQTG
ncbi:SDR family NAD(P)-dependent oxidoreductase [Pseudoroseomonas globiformis]|uniref:SDR family NAD(P)-dependent oxidoreductase n=1 Tax=Teichococcus globiformis TaxID=2307229 RepID=A0ABV7G268_9PROT